MATDKKVSVKISDRIVKAVKKNKKSSGINVGAFFELAAVEKLSGNVQAGNSVSVTNTNKQ